MAMIDYGAIAFKNGKLISTEMFTPMIDMVGWEDTEQDVYESRPHSTDEPASNYMKPIKLNGNYFAYIGDKDCTIAFYKEQLVLVERYRAGYFKYEHEWFNCTNYIWSRWESHTFHGEFYNKIRVSKRNGYLVCKWRYKDDKYKVYFGYGVDLNSYKRWRIVNYYRSPIYKIKKLLRWAEYKLCRKK